MYRVEELISILSISLDTRQKRHIVGGVLMSVAMLFGGLAITIIAIKSEDDNE